MTIKVDRINNAQTHVSINMLHRQGVNGYAHGYSETRMLVAIPKGMSSSDKA